MYVEGVRNVLSALDEGVRLQTLLVSKLLLRSVEMEKRVGVLRREGLPVWARLEDADARAGPCWLAARRFRNPGNLRTIVRTGEEADGGKGGLAEGRGGWRGRCWTRCGVGRGFQEFGEPSGLAIDQLSTAPGYRKDVIRCPAT